MAVLAPQNEGAEVKVAFAQDSKSTTRTRAKVCLSTRPKAKKGTLFDIIAMSVKEILEELPKLTQEEKGQLWNGLNHEVTHDHSEKYLKFCE